MGELRNSIRNTAHAVVEKSIDKLGKMLPARASRMLVSMAWTLGYGRSALADRVIDGAQTTIVDIRGGVREASLGVTSLAKGVAAVSKGAFGAVTGVIGAAKQVGAARVAAAELTAAVSSG